MIERIPADLRSDRALYDYFNRLFPEKVHSACVILDVPDLEVTARRVERVTRRLEKSIAYFEATRRRPTHIAGRPRINFFEYFNRLFPEKVHSACVILDVPDLEVTARRVERVTRRLEKSIAYFEATRRRPTHIAGRPRINFLNIECSPLEVDIGRPCHETYDFEEEGVMPPKGVVVDSIDYYTFDLAEMNQQLFLGQRKKAQIAHTGNMSIRADGWISKATLYASSIGASVIGESIVDNSLVKTPVQSTRKSFNDYGSINGENENNGTAQEGSNCTHWEYVYQSGRMDK